MFKKNKNNWRKKEGQVIDIESGMKGNLKFSTPVNLKISGKFEGELKTKGVLVIGEKADVRVKIIEGENVTIYGKVKGDIVCSERLEIFAPAEVIGNIKSPVLVINENVIFEGHCQVPIGFEPEKNKSKKQSGKYGKEALLKKE